MIASLALGMPALDPTSIVAVCVGLSVLVFFVGLRVAFAPRPVDARLAHFVGSYAPTSSRELIDPRFGQTDLIGSLNRRLARRGRSTSTRLLLQRANATMSVAELLLIRVASALILGGLAAVALVPTLALVGAALAAGAAFLGSLLPLAYLRVRASRRVAAAESQLPDTLDMIAAALQSGAGLSQALAIIAREMPAPISDEFRRVLREVELGLSLGEALTNLVNRLGSDNFDLVVTTINIQSRVGGNLVSILGTINQTIRERIRIRGEVKVLTSMQRMSAMVIGAIPPVIGVVLFLMNRSYMSRLLVPGIGETLLIGSVIMTILGILVLRKITDIEI